MANKKGGQRCICITVSVFAIITLVLFVLVIVFATKSKECEENTQTMPSITVSKYAQTDDGRDVLIYSLKNDNMEVKILNYGGIIVSIMAPDRNGHKEDVVLGFDSFDEYKTNPPYFGCLIGRYANRIAKGRFTLEGVTYKLAINNGPNSLHGGRIGFDKRIWDSVIDGDTLVLTYVSADMEEGYPGEVTVRVTYRLTNENALVIHYNATTTKTTVINLTNHAYFNLAKQNAGTLANHNIRLEADSYTPVDDTSIPTGVIAPVNRTSFDLRENLINMGTRIPEVPRDIGYDHNFVFGKSGWDKHMARVVETTTGRTLDVYSTQPGVQFYTAYYLGGTVGKGGYTYPRYGAFCLETQHYPDSPNQPSFPITVLRRGEVYKQTTRYVFGVVEN